MSDNARRGKAANPNVDAIKRQYITIPLPPRNPADSDTSDFLRDGNQEPHHIIDSSLYSGALTFTITAATPLIIPSSDTGTHPNERESKVKKTRTITRNGKKEIVIPPSSVLGMIRSAYELLTNSRHSILDEGKVAPERDMSPQDALNRLKSAGQFQTDRLPARSVDQLSPAERLFGWTATSKPQSGPAAVAAKVRISAVTLSEENNDGADSAIKTFERPLTLKPLLSPHRASIKRGAKPAPLAFGRKVYPHFHKGAAIPQSSMDKPKKTNFSVIDWIKPESQFICTLHFRNLTAFELGGLLRICDTGTGYQKLGGARPLGFGSVQLSVDTETTRISVGAQVQEAWNSLSHSPICLGSSELLAMTELFDKTIPSELKSAYDEFLAGKNFEAPARPKQFNQNKGSKDRGRQSNDRGGGQGHRR